MQEVAEDNAADLRIVAQWSRVDAPSSTDKIVLLMFSRVGLCSAPPTQVYVLQ